MLNFLPRTVRESTTIKVLWQACDIGRGAPTFDPETDRVSTYGSCYYCLYQHEVTDLDSWVKCVEKHSCKLAKYPFIQMRTPINREMSLAYPNTDGTWVDYTPTGIYRQIKINAQPLYVQFFQCANGEAKCNASCWFHGWRLDKKFNWRTCGKQHICHNDGSLYFLMAPSNPDLYKDFIAGGEFKPLPPDFNNDFNNDFLIDSI